MLLALVSNEKRCFHEANTKTSEKLKHYMQKGSHSVLGTSFQVLSSFDICMPAASHCISINVSK